MKITIDIPKEDYKQVVDKWEINVTHVIDAILKGTPYEERKTGKWIVERDCEGKTRTLICPFCKWKSGKYAWEDHNYCPNCGAKMEVDE